MVEIHLPPPPKIHGRGIDHPELNVKFHERTETDETHVYSSVAITTFRGFGPGRVLTLTDT
jgi:hypothetical protein